MFAGYRTKSRAPQLAVAERALQRVRLSSRATSSPAAPRTPTRSRPPGSACTCLADGVEHNHEPGERVSAQDLEMMLDIAITLVDEAAVELWRRRRSGAGDERA